MISFQKNLGLLVLSIYLILAGLTSLIPSLEFPALAVILPILMLVAGILILIGR